MKKLICVLMTMVTTMAWAGSGTIDINGNVYPVDTLECYQVGPGTTYTRFTIQMGSTKHNLYLLTADLTNPHLKAEEYQAMDHMGSTEEMLSAHRKIDSIGHRPIGSVNCNFWCVSGNISGPESDYAGLLGQPFSGTAKDGVLIGNPSNWNAQGDRGYLMIDELNRAIIRNMKFAGRVSKGSDTGRALRDCNRQRNNPNSNEIALFNRYIGTTRAIADTVLEVVFEPIDGQEWTINDTMQCVVLSRNNAGGTVLTGKMGALQGRGNRGLWMQSNLQVGDTFQLKLGMYSVSETADDNYSGDSIAPRVMQMVTGNCLVMANGVLTSRNTNEGYNNQNYPRTMLATNQDGTRLWMLVSQTPGNYTAEMCAMLRHDGATWAAGMDGGGSAQINLLGRYPFISKDGNPRPVANQMFLISTAPDDSDVARLEYVGEQRLNLSSYASYTPQLRSYNQYGWLLSSAEEGYTLSCEPASLGTISEDGKTFIASAEGGDGVLIATMGEASARLSISIAQGEMSLALDSLLIDTREYQIAAYSTGESGKKQAVDASLFSWASADAEVAEVSADGIVRGVSNGETDITGALGGAEVTMHVTVEIPDAPAMQMDCFATPDSLWTLKNTYGSMDWTVQDGRTGFTCDVNSARSPQLRIMGDWTMYSLPDAVRLTITSDVELKSMGFLCKAHNGTKQVSAASTPTMTVGEPTEYEFAISALGVDTADLAIYPIRLQTMVFTLQNVTIGTPYTIWLDKVELIYSHYIAAGMEETSGEERARKVIRDGQLYIERNGVVYDIMGRQIQNR